VPFPTLSCNAQEHASRARASKLGALQMSIEREGQLLAALQREHTLQTTSVHDTAAYVRRARALRVTIKDKLLLWQVWASWSPNGETCVLVDVGAACASLEWPWQPGVAAAGTNDERRSALHLSRYKLEQELARGVEELKFLPVDAKVLVAYYEYQRRVLLSHALSSPISRGKACLLIGHLRQVVALLSDAQKVQEALLS
jgi:hypothetical protein